MGHGSDLVFGIHYSVEEIYDCFNDYVTHEDFDIDNLNKILLNEFFVDGVKFYAELNPFDNHNPVEYYLGIALTIPMLKQNPDYKRFTNVIKEEVKAITRHINNFEYRKPDIYDIPYYYY
jgi:hypothetical protein